MRVATFNVESLDAPVKHRAGVLRPMLERLDADVLCLQEINAQHVPGSRDRVFAALDDVLHGTRYAEFNRAASHLAGRTAPADVHNLVTLSRFPIRASRQIWHDLVAPLETRHLTAASMQPASASTAIKFDRPALLTDIEVGGRLISIVNVHLRAPVASAIPGQKLSPFVWRSVAAWAEGYYHSDIKRTGQALEIRLVIEKLFDECSDVLVLVAGDFNAECNEPPLRLLTAIPEDTGNADLASRSLVVLDRSIDASRRFSIVHHGRPQMLDHMLASHALLGHFRTIEVHNEALGDEAIGYAKGVSPPGSYHAPLIATFAFD
jgi:endonuclease/exonuclease/phosphatase family metal-dependent hydrolase